jgi:hypothetical protein
MKLPPMKLPPMKLMVATVGACGAACAAGSLAAGPLGQVCGVASGLVSPTLLGALAVRRLLALDVVAASVVSLLAQLGTWVIFGLILGAGGVVPEHSTGLAYIVAINLLGAVLVWLAMRGNSAGAAAPQGVTSTPAEAEPETAGKEGTDDVHGRTEAGVTEVEAGTPGPGVDR